MAGLLNLAQLEEEDPLAVQGLLKPLTGGGLPAPVADRQGPSPEVQPDAEPDADEDEAPSGQDTAAGGDANDQPQPANDVPAGLLAQPQPDAQPGLLARFFGTDSRGATFRDRLLAGAMGLRGDLAGEGQFLKGVEQQAMQRQALQRSLGAQQINALAAKGAMEFDKGTGRARLNPRKFLELQGKYSDQTGIPVDPMASAQMLKSFSDDAGWQVVSDKVSGAQYLVNHLTREVVQFAGPSKVEKTGPGEVINAPPASTQGARQVLAPGGVPPEAGGAPAEAAPAETGPAAPPAAAPAQPPPQVAQGADWAPTLGAPTAQAGARAPTTASPAEVYRLAQTIDSEAGSEPLVGKVAAGSVALNRMASHYGGAQSLTDVLTPGEFNGLKVAGKPSAQALQIAQDLVAGKYADPTGGADHYLNPELTMQQRADHKVPQWAANWQTEGQRIGRHVFIGGRPGGGGATQVASAAQAGQPAAAVQPVPVKTPDEARKLPPGTPILLPDGRRGVVPGAPAQQAQQAQQGQGDGWRVVGGQPLEHKIGTPGTAAENIAHRFLPDAPTYWNKEGVLQVDPKSGYNPATAYKQFAVAQIQKSQNETLLNNIDEATKYLQQHTYVIPGTNKEIFNTAGGVVQRIPGVRKALGSTIGMESYYKAIGGALKADALERMRNMSPRGGAFGNTSTREFDAIGSIIRNLDTRKDVNEQLHDLAMLRQHYQAWQANIVKALNAGVTSWGNPYSGVLSPDAGGYGGDVPVQAQQ